MKSLKFLSTLAICAVLTLSLATCGGGDGGGSVDVTGSGSVAARITPFAVSEACPNGGIQVDTGIDEDKNGVLDPVEVDNTQYVCNGADGLAALVSAVTEPAGANCTYGGQKIEAGLDSNGDGALDAAEATSTSYVCDGAAGATGPAGSSGLTSLISITAEPAGANCTYGGQKIEAGLDSNGDGALDPAEATSTGYICNGAPVPSLPVIQSLHVSGVAQPLGTVTASVTAQSPEGLSLSYSWSASPSTWNIMAGGATNTVTILAPDEYSASGTATVTVTDSLGRSAVGVAALSTIGNRAPDVYLIAFPNPATSGEPVDVNAHATDPDGDSLSYSWSIPTGFTLLSDDGNGNISIVSESFLSQGLVTVTVSDGTDTARHSVMISTRDGQWGTAELIEFETGGAYMPQVAVDPNGNAVAVWRMWDSTRYNIWANIYNGTAWSTAELIETDDTGGASSPQVAVDPNGNGVTVWYQWDGTRFSIWANRYVASTGWGSAELIETDDTGDANFPQVAVDPAGNAVAVWQQSDGIRNSIWANTYNGTAWGTAELIETDDTGGASSPQVAVDSGGNTVAVWHQSDGTKPNIWANRYVSGTGWSTAELIETGMGTANSPQVAVDSSGNAVAVWYQYDGTGTRCSIWANTYNGTAWGTAELIETGAENAFDPQVTVDASGNAVAIWVQYDGIEYSIWANIFSGTGWGNAELIETGTEPATYPQVAADPGGRVVAVWNQPTDIWANHFR